MADIFDEIRDDLRAEKAQRMLRRYGALLIVAALLVVAGVAGWQVWRSRQAAHTNEVAGQFLGAMQKSDSPQAEAGATPARDAAASTFTAIGATGPEGYRTLARLRDAALRAKAGDTAGALQAWDQIGADTQADPLLRDLAALLWAQSQVERGEPAAVESHLAPLVAAGNPWRPLALEAQALLALRTGQDGRARDLLKQLGADPAVPDGVRTRVSGLLSRLGGASPAPTEGGG